MTPPPSGPESPLDAPPARRRTRWKIAALFCAAVLVAAGAIAGAKFWKSYKGLAVTTATAQMRTITQVATATGKIQPEVEVKISPEVYGEIVELPFREGAKVGKGDLIIRIRPDLYQAQVDQQTAAVASARGAAVDAKAKLEKARADLKHYEDLYRRNLVSDGDYIA